jgi:hypothetical protein
VLTLVQELAAASSTGERVLLAVDDYNALYHRSDYGRTLFVTPPSGPAYQYRRAVPIEQLNLVRLLACWSLCVLATHGCEQTLQTPLCACLPDLSIAGAQHAAAGAARPGCRARAGGRQQQQPRAGQYGCTAPAWQRVPHASLLRGVCWGE